MGMLCESLIMKHICLIIALATLFVTACRADETKPAKTNVTDTTKIPEGAEYITLGAGCFWCTEAIFQQVPGVISVTSGYIGGTLKNPKYEQVCTGKTGHAEVSRIV